jgi:hypothetical protein
MYNEAAALLSLLPERLTFVQVIHTTSLAESDILQVTWQDICLLPWTQPSRRDAMVLHYGVKWAKEEIRYFNVKITCLLMFLVDEHVDYYRAIAANIIINPPLSMELQKW